MTDDKNRDYSQIHSDQVSLKELVFLKLDKYPNASPKEICRLLHINYYVHGGTVRSYKYEFRKRQLKNRHVLKSLSYHNVRFFGYALADMDPDKITVFSRNTRGSKRWFVSRAKNRMLVYKDNLGRIEWFRTGRINCWIKKPATAGKMKQLLANAFYAKGIIKDVNVFSSWADSFRLKGFHLVLDTGERLPYARISNLKDETGVVAVIGDASHRTGLELQVILPEWRERQEQLNQLTVQALDNCNLVIQKFNEVVGNITAPKPLDPNNRFTV